MASLWEASRKNVFNNPIYPAKRERQLACASATGTSGEPSPHTTRAVYDCALCMEIHHFMCAIHCSGSSVC